MSARVLVFSVATCCALLLPATTQAQSPAGEQTPSSDDGTAVYGGDFVDTCNWPTTVSMAAARARSFTPKW